MTGRLRAWVGGIVHESNSFSPIPTGREDFTPWGGPAAGAAQWPGYAEFIELAQADGMAVCAGFFVGATPSAPVSAGVWAGLRAALLESLAAAGPVDIVWLVLHGAQMAEGCDDCEGDLLGAVRQRVGPVPKVGVLLDLHTNLSAAMLRHATLLVACKHYPHTDLAERAAEAYRLLRGAAQGRLHPVMAAVRVPGFGTFPTTEPPFDALVQRLQAAESIPGVLSASALHGFFGGDGPDLASAVLVVADGDAALARQQAAALGEVFLALIRHAPRQALTVADALQAVMAVPPQAGRPVVLADRADNPGGGAAGDSTVVLAALLGAAASHPGTFTPAALAPLWDPQAAELAHRAGLGARLALRIGGKTGPLSGAPLDLAVQVLALRDDAEQALFGNGAPLPLGRSAVLRAGTPDAPVDIVVNSLRTQAFSPDVFTAFGLSVPHYRLLVVKSTQHFHAGFAPLASAIVRCDAPGTVAADVTSLPYRRLRRPMWPWDAEVACTPFEVQAGPEPDA
jgi:microcystin degradation protein MlrC